ncbi:hypothetical protein BZA77DRAFT_375911 [Pyronema omphalodes]|nr:hypothetical protein BZA77DRAFT_375911 [Pyronema omphalodes]
MQVFRTTNHDNRKILQRTPISSAVSTCRTLNDGFFWRGFRHTHLCNRGLSRVIAPSPSPNSCLLLCVTQASSSSSKNDASPLFPPDPPQSSSSVGSVLPKPSSAPIPSVWDFFAACCHRRRRPRRYMPPPSRVLTPEERRERLISNARYLQRVRDEEIRAQQQNTHNMDLEAGIELASLAALIGNGRSQATQHSRPRAGSRAVPSQISRPQ